MKRSYFKSKSPKSSAIRKSARNEDYTICIPLVCNGGGETTVLCHSNELSDGHEMGLKVPDYIAAYGCNKCHDVVDRRVPLPDGVTWPQVEHLFKCGIEFTQRILKLKGLI